MTRSLAKNHCDGDRKVHHQSIPPPKLQEKADHKGCKEGEQHGYNQETARLGQYDEAVDHSDRRKQANDQQAPVAPEVECLAARGRIAERRIVWLTPMRNDPRVRTGDTLLILFGVALAVVLLLHFVGII